jgi:DNA polymerase-1
LFVDVDYDAAELRSLAQITKTLVGFSKLAEVFQDPKADPHTDLGARILGIDRAEAYRRKSVGDKEMKAARQRAKAPNFGFPGGMGIAKFVDNHRKQIIKAFVQGDSWELTESFLTEPEGKVLRDVWRLTWPEMDRYFGYVNDVIGMGSVGRFRTLVSGRYRGGCGYCDGANNGFQSLTADGAGASLYELVRRMYMRVVDDLDPCAILYSTRLVNFVHDEAVVEAPAETAPEVGDIVSRVMVESMMQATPDIQATTSPAIMARWYKGADTVRDANGRLVIWAPKK